MRRSSLLKCIWYAGAAATVACQAVPTDASPEARALRPILAGGDRTYAAVAAGFVHTCALAIDGAAFCWGNDDYGQLGSATDSDLCGGRPCSRTPVAVSGGLRFSAIAAGWVQNCAIATDRHVYCWGGGAMSAKGYLGDGALQQSRTPVQVRADSVFVVVTIGDGHSCALTASGMAFCWGQNPLGQIGDGTNQDRAIPVPVKTDLRFRELSAGAYHVCGVTMENDAVCWGDNRWGELGAGEVDYNAVAAAASTPVRVGGIKVSSIAAGWEHTCAIGTNGTTYCWGRNEDARQLGDESLLTHRGVPGPIAGSQRFISLFAGALSTCGRTAGGETYCWGGDYYGALGNGEAITTGVGHPVRTLGGPFVRVGIGQAHACAIATDSRLWCWGDQSAGQF